MSDVKSRSEEPALRALESGTKPDLSDASLFINRELSWLEFNQRVLDQARSPEVPLFERLKFLAITSTNLDEFFMVRVAGVKQQVAGKVEERGADGLSPAQTLREVSKRSHEMVQLQYKTLREDLIPALHEAGVQLVRPRAFLPNEHVEIATYFREQIFPVLTPLAVDPGHPFPNLRNRSLNLAVRLRRGRRAASLAVVQVPSVLARFVPLSGNASGLKRYAWLEDVIAERVAELFPGTEIESCYPFRLTRNFDLNLDEEDADDLLKMIEKEVRRRDRGNAVRLEIDEDADDSLRADLMDALRLSEEDVYRVRGPLHLGDLMWVYQTCEPVMQPGAPRLKDEPFVPAQQPAIRVAPQMMPLVAQGDLLLHHPYESFDPVVDFVEEAAEDPDVLAIKQTLYRTSGGSPIIKALARAAENRKQVTAIVELKARFDEENNIAWARALEEAGVHVVYGLIGLKTHCKMCLVVRRESGAIKRYLHLSTGNYSPTTAKVYTDLSLFTAKEPFCRDASALFNLLTGNASADEWERFAVAPLDLFDRVVGLIEDVAEGSRRGVPGRITAKMNSLVDRDVIRTLYRASQAGVKIELLVRGICCLKPGVPGVSDNIRVRSVVDRFLEHSRVYHFVSGEKSQVFLSSADWMPRNFQRRVEVLFPVEDPALAHRLTVEILGTLASEDARSAQLGPDGVWRPFPENEGFRPQQKLLAFARELDKPVPLRPAEPLTPVRTATSDTGSE